MASGNENIDNVGARIIEGRSSDSKEQIGSASSFMPEQAWMISQASMDVVDQEIESVILQ